MATTGRRTGRERPNMTSALPLALAHLVACAIGATAAVNAAGGGGASQPDSSALSPNLLNLAEGRNIWASATCGDGAEREEYCILGETNMGQDLYMLGQVVQGQLCDYCDMRDPRKSHPARYAIENNHKYWQSPPLSRSSKYNEVNLTIDLGQDFHVAYVYIVMGISPRPGVWALERSVDLGKTFHPWQYFASDEGECKHFFGQDVEFTITRDDSVICETKYSSVLPFQHGEIHVPIVTGRPSLENFSSSESLQEWSRATNIRLRLIRTKTLLADVLSVNQQDPTVTRRYFYSIRHIEVGGRCVCNGHASHCSPTYDGRLRCHCEHNTDGDQCGVCHRLHNQRPWQAATVDNPNTCEACNCHEHADSCIYNATVNELGLSMDSDGEMRGGGVCQDCLHHTAGINCERCEAGFYREEGKDLTDEDVCSRCPCQFVGEDAKRYSGECEDITARCKCDEKYQEPNCDDCRDGFYGYPLCKPCDCFRNGTENALCHNNGNKCPCKENFGGAFCKECASGFFDHPQCQPCECNPAHSLTPDVCDTETGKCQCSNGFGGRQCDQCELGYFQYPNCKSCDCQRSGVTEAVCEAETGRCFCKAGFTGERCDRCAEGFFGLSCSDCGCSAVGSVKNSCSDRGRCKCRLGWTGDKCDRCAAGYYWKQANNECVPCNCDRYGADGESCDSEGRCICKPNFQGGENHKCSECAPGHYTYPFCEACNCNPVGTSSDHTGCQTGGDTLCVCKPRVGGRRCDTCKPLFWNLRGSPEGCEDCRCDESGSHSGIMACDPRKGQCPCKSNRDGRACTRCIDGTWKRNADNLFGCEQCECNPSGSLRETCDERSGCRCRNYITGMKCNEPIKLSYIPTFHQFKYEVENFRTPTRNVVRQGSNEADFPGFSGMGYAVFSELQPVVIVDVDIKKNSMHHVVLRYINPSEEAQDMLFIMTPGTSDEVPAKKYRARLPPASSPSFIRLQPFEEFEDNIVPGPWTIEMQAKNVSVDYLVTVPWEYLSAAALKEDIKRPCRLGEHRACRRLAYPPLERATETFPGVDNSEVVDLGDLLDGVTEKASVLSSSKPLDVELNGPETASVFFVEYTTKRRDPDEFGHGDAVRGSVVFEMGQDSYKAQVTLPYCRYNFLCRQAVIDTDGRVFESPDLWDEKTPPRMKITLNNGSLNEEIYVHKISAIPRVAYKHDLLDPNVVCIQDESVCHGLKYSNLGKKVHFSQAGDVMPIDPRLEDRSVRLVELSPKKPSVIIDGDVNDDSSGPSTVLIHYYQPDSASFEADIKIEGEDGIIRKGKVLLAHCPSTTGCRARAYIERPQEPLSISLQGRYSLEVKLPVRKEDDDMLLAKHLGKRYDEKSLGPYGETWLDYAVISPSTSAKDVRPLPYDLSRKFRDRCVNDSSYYLDPKNMSEFCKDGLFRVTTAFNNGALRCHCSTQGSNSFNCEPYGGQCSCKDNVIGRQCTECKPGYYGFPYCKKCKCPENAVCDKVTGDCRCPPHVVGENCDRCKPLYFDFSATHGCAFCDCSMSGVRGGNLQCDLVRGDCDCRENVGGRKCDRCQDGYYGYPHCRFCQCDQRGVRQGICDKQRAQCFCKDNVDGRFCESCRQGYFFLDENNPLGCTKCFCSGKTSSCDSAPMRRTSIHDVDGWMRVTVNIETFEVNPGFEIDVEPSADNTAVVVTDLTGIELDENEAVYLRAPDAYINSRLTSYGGKLNISIFSALEEGLPIMNDEEPLLHMPDVILVGEDGTSFVHVSGDIDKARAGSPGEIRYEVPLRESAFGTEMRAFRRSSLDRAQFMNVLSNVHMLLIRATYFKGVDNVAVSVIMDDSERADDIDEVDDDRVYSVEECHCPPGYAGLSCEQCAKGYYRHGAHCVACQCHGHAEECDLETGVCFNCAHNTEGDHCEHCRSGYYGTATAGRPDDCHTCPCPLAIESNNFAISCDLSSADNAVRCVCPDGYAGTRCELCDVGYWGEPTSEGGSCQPCECNDNADLSLEGNCDKYNGTCLNCRHHTAGPHCDLCEPWYWGDAVTAKDCSECGCHRRGAERCEAETGVCVCRKNVAGSLCDQCAPDHWGLESGHGCLPCDCGPGANSTSCSADKGECSCKPGVTGPKCDQCAQGFWNLTDTGCQPCNCDVTHAKGMSCNPSNGQCVCLPGVVGDRCERCPERFAFVPNEGCVVCDSCHHTLLDSAEELQARMYVLEAEAEGIDAAILNNRALQHFSEEMTYLKKEIEAYKDVAKATDLDSLEDDLLEQNENVRQIEKRLENFEREGESLRNDLRSSGNPAADVEVLQNLHDRVKELTRRTLDYSQQVDNQLVNDIPLKEADALNYRRIADDIAKLVQGLRLDSNTETTVSNLLTPSLRENELKPFIEQIDKHASINETVNKIKDTLSKAEGVRRRAEDDVREASKILSEIKENSIHSLVAQAAAGRNTTEDTLKRFTSLVEDTKKMLKEISEQQPNLQQLSSDVTTKKAELQAAQGQLVAQRADLFGVVDDAVRHQTALRHQVEAASQIFGTGAEASSRHVEAANRYEHISNNVTESGKIVKDADEGLKAIDGPGLIAMTSDALSKSQGSKFDADKQLGDVDEIKKHLRDVSNRLKETEGLNEQRREIFKNFDMALIENGAASQLTDAEQIRRKAEIAKERAQKVLEQMRNGTGKAGSIISDMKAFKDAERYILDAEQLMREHDLPKKLGDIDARINSFNDTQKRISANLEKLREKILVTRGIADSIPVGLELSRSPLARLKYVKPNALRDIQAWMDIGMYVNTSVPDAALLYIGPDFEEDTRTKRQALQSISENLIGEYLLIKLESGKIALDLALNSDEVQHFVHNKTLFPGEQYFIKIERTGTKINMSVRKENDSSAMLQTYRISGNSFVLNIGPTAPIMIGHAPREAMTAPLRGQISNLVVNNIPIGMWEYRSRGDDRPYGCMPQNFNEDLKPVDASWTRFNGKGYAVLEKSYRHNFRSGLSLQMTVKTHSPEGLLFTYHNRAMERYLILQINDGRPELLFNLGDFAKGNFSVNYLVNNGNEAGIFVSASGTNIILQVDAADGTSAQNNLTIPREAVQRGEIRILENLSERFNLGGMPLSERNISYPGMVKTSYEGCIKELVISSAFTKISQIKNALGVSVGCRQDAVRKLSLRADQTEQHKYLRLDRFEGIEKIHSISFRFKTKERNGLIFFAKSGDPIEAMLILSVVDGNLVVYTKPGDKFEAGTMLNMADNRWHFAVLQFDINRFSVVVDDQRPRFKDFEGRSWRLELPYYFGGLDDENSAKVNLASKYVQTQFSGCIADFAINDQEVNFDTGKSYGVTLSSCKAVSSNDLQTDDDPNEGKEKDKQCRLKYAPEILFESGDAEAAYRYGSLPNTRGESLIDSKGKLRSDTIVEFEFRIGSYFEDGTLFLAASSGPRIADFVLIHMLKGNIKASFDLGGGMTTVVIPNRRYNDGKYHRLKFERRKKTAVLVIDDDRSKQEQAKTNLVHLDDIDMIFVGGMRPEGVVAFTKRFPSEHDSFISFPGCIKDVVVNSEPIMFSETLDRVLPCSSEQYLEDGAYFGYQKGKRVWLRLFDEFNTTNSAHISMTIKARRSTGVLFFTANSLLKTYVALYLLNGTVVSQVSNNGQITKVEYAGSKATQLCDGQWHRIDVEIQMIVVGLGVDDDTVTQPTPGMKLLPDVLSDGPVYIGGIPKGIGQHALDTTSSYGGCIKDVFVGDMDSFDQRKETTGVRPRINLAATAKDIQGDVFLSTCYNT